MNRYPEPTRTEPAPRTMTDNAVVSWVFFCFAILGLTIGAALMAGPMAGIAVFGSGFAGLMMGHSNTVLGMKRDGYAVDRIKGSDGVQRWRIGVLRDGGAEWM